MRKTREKLASAFNTIPEPHTVGSVTRGQQILAGNYHFAGHLIKNAHESLWGLKAPSETFTQELHGFIWLDDLAAVGDLMAQQTAREWVFDWMRRFSDRRGAAWSADITGRRLIRLINHSPMLLNGQESQASDRFFNSLAQQTAFLAKRWKGASSGLPRFEALTGLIYAGLVLEGMDEHVKSALAALGRECDEQIDQNGSIPTRNPEELLEVFTLLIWTSKALIEAGKTPNKAHLAAIERIAPTLRALRHSDGGLVRFHGGGRGLEGRLDKSLADSRVRGGAHKDGHAMGCASLRAGRTSVIIDASAPPQARFSAHGHASTLAFELTTGRRPLIVSCGPGIQFGEDWERAGRSTSSHSVLGIEGHSSSKLDKAATATKQILIKTPKSVEVKQTSDENGSGILGVHDGYKSSHGLVHMRKLTLSEDGRELLGQDTLVANTNADKKRFDKVMDAKNLKGIPFLVRFHLHPEVEAELDMGGTAVSLSLKNDEIWVFRHQSTATLSLEISIYLENNRLRPRAAQQVLLTGYAVGHASRIDWALAKAHDTPDTLRDLVRDRDDEIET